MSVDASTTAPAARRRERAPRRGRAWRTFGVVALVFAIYCALWVSYAANGLTTFGRYTQLDPGATGVVDGVEFRVLQLRQSSVLADQDDGEEPKTAEQNAVWVVAELEVTRRADATEEYCRASLLGPQRREWEATSIYSGRTNETSCSAEDLKTGVPTRLELVFEVPTRFADQLYGLVLQDLDNQGASQVIRPA